MNAFVAVFDGPAAGQRVREASDARLRNKASIRHLLPSHLLASRWRHIDRARQEVPSAVTGGDGRDGGYADPNLAHSTPSLSEPTMVSSAAVPAILSALPRNPSLIPIERSKQTGNASVGKEGGSPCRSGWSPSH